MARNEEAGKEHRRRTRQADNREHDRKLARYPEAIALLRLATDCFASAFDGETWEAAQKFLAAEPAERGEGGAG